MKERIIEIFQQELECLLEQSLSETNGSDLAAMAEAMCYIASMLDDFDALES